MARPGGVVQRHGGEPVAADHPTRGVRKPAAPLHLRRQPRAADAVDHGAHGRRPDLRPQRRPRAGAAAVDRVDGQRTGPVRDACCDDLLEISRHDAGVAELSGGVGRSALRRCESALDNVGHLANDADVELIVDTAGDGRHRRGGSPPRRNASCATSSPTPSTTPSASPCGSGWPPTTTPSPSPCATTAWVCAPARRSWCSAGSGARTRRGVRRSGGTGLGLAISIEDARLHQGRLEAWGEPGKGASLPPDPAAGARPQGDHEPAAAEAGWAPTGRAPTGRETRTGGEPARETRRGRGALLVIESAWWAAPACRVPPRRRRSAPSTAPRRPACPRPTPGMDPDVLLREFLKATADPANRHLAARQFLTESAFAAWDDAGSALLIDRVVFVETRGPERVSVHMQADILGSLSDVGRVRNGRGRAARPRADRTGQDARRPAHRQAAQRRVPGLAAVSGRPTSATRCTSPTRPARPSCPTRAMSRCPMPTSWPPNWSRKLIVGPAAGDGQARSATCSARRCGCAAR